MGSIPVFEESHIESLSKVLGECGSGTDISRFLNLCGIEDTSGESTKWRRLNTTFVNLQRKHRCANHIVDFISKFFSPVRFVGRNEQFEALRSDLNLVLAFAGLEYGADGKFRNRTAVSTITEAEARLKTLRAKFQGRLIHIEVLKYCKVELLQDNYFHAVFEASKGLAQRIREMSGVDGDGTALIDRVFSVDRPVLAFTHSKLKPKNPSTREWQRCSRGVSPL